MTHTYIEKDWSTEKNANELASKIREYWRNKGMEVKTWLDSSFVNRKSNNSTFWNVRSDMINGLPR